MNDVLELIGEGLGYEYVDPARGGTKLTGHAVTRGIGVVL
jgi:hypothetical protein